MRKSYVPYIHRVYGSLLLIVTATKILTTKEIGQRFSILNRGLMKISFERYVLVEI